MRKHCISEIYENISIMFCIMRGEVHTNRRWKNLISFHVNPTMNNQRGKCRLDSCGYEGGCVAGSREHDNTQTLYYAYSAH